MRTHVTNPSFSLELLSHKQSRKVGSSNQRGNLPGTPTQPSDIQECFDRKSLNLFIHILCLTSPTFLRNYIPDLQEGNGIY